MTEKMFPALYFTTATFTSHIPFNHADLFRINGVGPQFAELLEKAGVDTVKEFRHRVAENLQPKLEEINTQFHICGRVPAVTEVQRMIDQAKELEPKMTY